VVEKNGGEPEPKSRADFIQRNGSARGQRPLTRRNLLGAGVVGAALIGIGAATERVLTRTVATARGIRGRPAPVDSGAKPAFAVSGGASCPADVSADSSGSPVIRAENALAGTADWRITRYAGAGEIQGYAGQPSVNAGQELNLFVSVREPGTRYRIDFYRMGWYGGAGARLMTSVPDLRGQAQGYHTGSAGLVGARASQYEASTGLLDAHWEPSYRLRVPSDWVSGAYLALLTDSLGRQTYVPFVVRQDDRPSALLLKASFNTYQAYNAWGGKSLYADNSLGANTVGGSPGAVKVSFNRPFDADLGSGEFLRYEYNVVRWIERMGYDVSYVADGDIATNAQLLQKHHGFISTGHDEYWTAAERNNLEQALARGLHLAFLSGDAVYWQARHEPSASGDSRRTLVVYRSGADPMFKADPVHATVRWQDAPVNRPQHMLTGTLYAGQTEPFTQDWVVADTNCWLYEGTGLKPGDRVRGIIGKEFDRAPTDMLLPPGLQILSHSPVTVTADDRPPDIHYQETTVYTAPSGATVFSAGTVTWGWGLDSASFPIGALHATPVSPAIQRMTRNLLDRFVVDAASGR
jgi:hypothetical protein